jgi:hypothetical protein
VEAEFSSKKEQIKEQVQEAILARYLPESMLRRIALDRDPQVRACLQPHGVDRLRWGGATV